MDSVLRDEMLHYEMYDPSVVHLVNMTPHEITLVGENGEIVLRIPPSGTVARCREEIEDCGTVTAGPWGPAVRIYRRRLGEIEGLPEPEFRTIYITSALVAHAAWALGRRDVVHPGELVRDEQGRVVGCRGLVVAPE